MTTKPRSAATFCLTALMRSCFLFIHICIYYIRSEKRKEPSDRIIRIRECADSRATYRLVVTLYYRPYILLSCFLASCAFLLRVNNASYRGIVAYVAHIRVAEESRPIDICNSMFEYLHAF